MNATSICIQLKIAGTWSLSSILTRYKFFLVQLSFGLLFSVTLASAGSHRKIDRADGGRASHRAATFACPTLTFASPASSATLTQCANTTVNLSVIVRSVTAAGGSIQFVYFTSPLANTASPYTAPGSTVLGTVNMTSVATQSLSLNIQLPDIVGTTGQTWYVYALLKEADGICKVTDKATIVINPRPEIVVGGPTEVCQGKTAKLLALPPNNSSYQWYLNSGTAVVGTTNPYTTSAITTTTTFRVRSKMLTCQSDEVSITLTPVVCTSCTATPTSIGGVAYRDFGSDGGQGANDLGMSDVTVTLFNCDASGGSTQVASMNTDINGAYSFTGLTAGTNYRVEFSNLPAGYEPTYRGAQNGTMVQFTQPGSCSISIGLNQPADYCQPNPTLITACYLVGRIDGTGPTDALVSFPYDFSNTEKTMAVRTQVGSIWGVGYDKIHKKVYTAAFLKRGSAMGPNGLGAIYLTNPNATSANATLFFDLGTVDNVGASLIDVSDAARGLGSGPADAGHDDAASDLIAKVGLGGLDVSDDGAFVYTISLASKKLWRIPTNAPTSANVTSWSITNLPNWDLTKGDYRPFAVKYHNNKVYVGVTFDAEASQDKNYLAASVYELDPATGVFSEVITFPMSYTHGNANKTVPDNGFYAWIAAPPRFLDPNWTYYPQPVLSAIEFDSDGTVTLGVMDRAGHQFAPGGFLVGTNNNTGIQIAGDILRLGVDPTDPTKYRLESTGKGLTSNGTIFSGAVNNQGPNGGEFYSGEQFNNAEETSLGGLTIKPGSGEVILAAMDPLDFFTSGFIALSQTTGAKTRSLFVTDQFGKGNGLGNVELACDLAPIQIGNRVWRDDNQNGIQDPCEPAIPGAVVTLYDATRTTAIASATTNAAGEYYFASVASTTVISTSAVSTTALQYNTDYALVITSLGSSTVVTGLALTDVSPVTPGVSGTANTGTTQINNDALVVNGKPTIQLTTGGPGENNHTYDFGIAVASCAKPTLASIASQSICQGSTFSMPLVSSITSNTVTALQWYLTNAAGTSFTAISGATSLSLSAAQAVVPTVGQSKYYALIGQNGLSALCSDTVLVNLYMQPTQTIAFTAPATAAVTQCANSTITLSVTTSAKAPDAVRFVSFTSPLASPAAAYTATGGTTLGTVTSGTLATNTVSLANFQLADNVGETAQTLYVYALVQSANGICTALPADQFTLTLNPRPLVSIGGDAIFCQGTTTQLTALGVSGGTYQWFVNGGTTAVSTANPYTTPAISTTTTYQVRATLGGCVSDLVSYTLTPVVCTSCTGGTGTVGGQVYQDFSSDGTKQANDLGVAGVTVTIFRCDANGSSTQVAQMLTDINGAYSFTGLTAGTDYRVEFSNLPAGTQPTYRGTQNGTTVQFTKPGSCSISLGINYPTDFCQANPKVLVPCYENGTGTSSIQPGFVSFDYGTTTKRADGTIGEVGSVWGVAYQRTTGKTFTSAFLKRHVGFAGQGPGGIYVYDYANPAVNAPLVASFSLQGVTPANGGAAIDLGSVTRVTSPATDPNYISTSSTTPNYDIDAFAKVGKMSYGDADIDETNNRLWLVNLYQRAIISLNISGTATSLNGASVATLSPLTNQYMLDNLPGIPSCGTDGVFRPWALAFHRGKGYLGGVCSSETSKDPSKMVSYVLEFDPNNVGAGFTTVMTVPMNYPREQLENKSITSLPYRVDGTWRTWINAYADIPGAPANPGRLGWPQPILSDIDFADNGDMVMGFTDRLSHQWGMSNYLPVAGSGILTEMNAGGDILHACFVNGAWLLEGTAGSCKTNDILNNSSYFLANDGPSKTGEFYPNDIYFDGTNGHYETANGGLVILPGKNEVITTAFDINGLFQQGVNYFSTTSGVKNAGSSFAVVPNGTTTAGFGKGNGLGDLEVACNVAPVQIGNRVWRDDNRNGIQDPCEPAIPGAVVNLYDATRTTLIASTTTNAAGEYYFSSTTITVGNSTSSVATTALQYNTSYALVISSLGTSTVATGLTLTDVSPVTPGESGTANTGTTQINNDALVVNGKPTIQLTTGGPGENNHTYDFGIAKVVCSLTATAQASSQTICSGQPLTLTAQASPVASYTYVWTAPTGVTLTGANTATATATASVAGLQTFTVTVSSSPSCSTTATVSASVVHCTPKLAIAITDAGTCLSATNGYTTTGTLSLTNAIAGIATFTDGSVSTTVAVSAGATSVPYSLSGLNSGTGVHTVTVSYASQTASVTYTAPASCTVAPVCSLTAVATPGLCQSATNTYTNTVVVNLSNPTAGVLTITDGASSLTFATQVSTSASYTAVFNGLVSNGAQHTVTASLPGCSTVTTTYTAPASCTVAPVCSLTAVATPGLCQSATNTYTNTVVVNLSNPTAGVLTITDGASSLTFATQVSTSASYTAVFNGLVSNGAQHTVTASLPGCSTATTTYTAPASCTVVPLLASLGDYVWLDTNKNGQQDPAETGVASVTAVLCDAISGTVISTTLTDGTGKYLFTNLNPGSYVVKFTAPTGTTFTSANTGPDATDSDVASVTANKGATGVYSLSAGEQNLTVDAGLVPLLASLGDYVWLDTNKNGQQDPAETGVASVTAVLCDAISGTVISTTLTDGTGKYLFTNLNPGSYVVKFTAPSGTTFTSANTGPDATDSDVASVTANKGATGVYSLSAGEQNLTVDAGLIPLLASLGDYVWLDTNKNGQQDPAETGVANVTAVLCDAISGTVISTTLTDGTGKYLFTNLNPGSYVVKFTAPSGTTFTSANTGPDATDSDVASITANKGATGVYSLSAGKQNLTVDAGLIPLTASLGDYVWLDVNKNGQQDPTETGVASVTAVLCDAVSGTVISTTLTDGTGKYLFTNLSPGSYIVKFTAPTGTTFTSANTGPDATDSDVASVTANKGATGVYSLSAGEQNLTVDAGLVPLLASLGDYVWLDGNKNGQQDPAETGVANVTAVLCDAISGTVISTTLTDGTGKYLFTNLNPGSYVVKFTAPLGTTFTSANTGPDATDSDVASVTANKGTTGVYSLSAGEQNLTVDAGLVPLLASLGDKVFADLNTNGVQDIADTPISGVKVSLLSSGTLVAITTTNANGVYSFTGLTPGVPYSVSFTTPTGFTATTPLVGANPAFDSDPVNGITAPVTLTVSENNPTIDAGFVPLLGSIGNFVWKDNNNNGIQDPNEPGVEGIIVELFAVVNGTIGSAPIATTATSTSGLYAFTGLPSGQYQVKFTVPASQTDACQLTDKVNAGTNDATDSDINPLTGLSPIITIDVTQPVGSIARNNTTIDLGLQRRIYDPIGYIYCYKNNTIIKGGTIHVTGPGSVTITRDGSDGTYQFFTDGTPGKYTMTYTHPGGYSLATVQRPVAYSELDPTGLDGSAVDKDGLLDGWVRLGSVADSRLAPTHLLDVSASANPYYLVFDVVAGDPYISENNLPVDCDLPVASLGDRVWLDANKNGQQDPAETGVASVTAVLCDAVSGTAISTTLTDGTGTYLFTNLSAGSYIVKFTAPTGTTFTTGNVGPDVTDSDVVSVTANKGATGVYSLSAGEQNLTVDAGLVPLVTSMSIRKFVSLSKAKPGDVLTYTLVVTNTGMTNAMNVTVRDSSSKGLRYVANSATTPAGTTFTQGVPTSSWTLGNIAAGQSLSMTFQAVADSSGILYNTATVPGDTAKVCTSVPAIVCKGSNYLFRLVAPLGRSSYRWFRNNVEITGQTTNVLLVNAPGSYSLAVNNASGQCSDFSCCPFIVEEDSLPTFQVKAIPVSCLENSPQADGKLVLSDFNATYTYQYSLGASFNATASLSGGGKRSQRMGLSPVI